MKFNPEKLRQIAKPMPEKERQEMEYQIENQDWLIRSISLALKIRSIMKELGITQSELARRMKVTPAQISKIISGQENLCLKTIAKVEMALGKPLFKVKVDDYSDDESSEIRVQYVPIPVFVTNIQEDINSENDFATFNLIAKTALG